MIPLLILIIAAFIIGAAAKWLVVETNWNRGCAGRAWRTAFPDADKQDIRDFLQEFVDAFCFSTKERLHFRPNDAVMDIYNTVKGLWWDEMELEFFADGLKDRFGLNVESCWHERITLGEIFALATSRAHGNLRT